MNFVTKHPVLTGFGILFGLATIVAYWPLFLLLTLIAALAYALYVVTVTHDQQALARAHRKSLLAAHADYEHWCLMNGHPAGVYGQYPPA